MSDLSKPDAAGKATATPARSVSTSKVRPLIAIGNQTAFSAATLLEPFEYAIANSFDAFEFFPDKKPSGEGWDSADLNAEERARIRTRAAIHGIRLSVHTHWAANPLLPEAFPILWRDLELAEAIGGKLLNIHLYLDAGVGAFARAVAPLLEKSAAKGIQVSIENTPETHPAHFNELFRAINELGLPGSARTGMCFDMGHANLCSGTQNDFLGYFDQLGPHVPLVHVHAHENWGDADAHLPLFTGPAAQNPSGVEGLLLRIKARGYRRALILEQWPQPPSLLNAARDRLTAMLDGHRC
jgi:sugar phosphate isomerase/epimerase